MSKTIIYFGRDGAAIGFTRIEPAGEADSFPYRSLMKWGGLTRQATQRLFRMIK